MANKLEADKAACVNGPEGPNRWSIALTDTELLIEFVQQEGEAELTLARQEAILDCMTEALRKGQTS